MWQRIQNTLDIISLAEVSAPIAMSDRSVINTFYTHLYSTGKRFPNKYTSLIVKDFNASTKVDKTGSESIVGSFRFGVRNIMDFALLVSGYNFLSWIAGFGILILAV